jgi:hypothetical protein
MPMRTNKNAAKAPRKLNVDSVILRVDPSKKHHPRSGRTEMTYGSPLAVAMTDSFCCGSFQLQLLPSRYVIVSATLDSMSLADGMLSLGVVE